MSSRRGSVGKPHAAASSKGGAAVAAASQAASHELEKLRALLLESLTSTISDTVDTVCEEFEESFARAAQALPLVGASNGASSASASTSRGGKANGATADYDMYYSCCQRLVSYIDANMETSPDFKQQMDRIILACHSNASDRVLSSVVTKRLWFHKREDAAEQDEEDVYAKREVYVESEEDDDDDDDEVVEVERTKPMRSKMKPSGASAPSRGPVKETPRGTKRRAPPPPPPAPVAKPSRHSKGKTPVAKRARREVAVRKVTYAPSEDEEESEEDNEPVERKPARRQNRVQSSDEDDGDQEEDEDDVVYVANEAKSQPHYGQGDELLNFKDAIGDMCYADRRTPAQTRFFKDRLRKAIQFVDSQLCKPPKGKVCKWECAKIRKQMCNRDLPCRNKICRLWHDVEAHTDRCQNAHCEFRIRVMLRETMYKIDHKKMELLHYRNELHEKKKKLLELKHENLSDRESYVEKRLLDNEIGQLEADVESADRDLGVFKATKRTYWATLNEIGITVEDDVNDQFPDFNGHYVDKKAPVKKKTPTKARKTASNSTSTPASARPQRARRMSSPSVGSAIELPEAGSKPQRERIARRSTTQSLQAMTNGVIELDGDDDEDNEEEETKTDRSVEEEEERMARLFQNGGHVEDEEEVTYVDGGPEETRAEEQDDNNAADEGDAQGGDADMSEGDQPPQDDEQEDEAPSSAVESREDASAERDDVSSDQPRNETESSPSRPPRSQPSANESPAKGLIPSLLAILPGTSALAAFNEAMNSPAPAPDAIATAPVLVQAHRPEPAEETASTTAADDDSGPLLPF